MKLKLITQTIFKLSARVSIMAFCLFLSIFIYLNVIEKVALVDIPYVSSVTKTSFPSVIYQVENGENPSTEMEKYGFLGKPGVLRIPLHNFSLSIGEEKKSGSEWLVSNQVVSYHVYEKSQGGNIGSFVLFAAPKSGQLAIIDVLVEGDRIMIDTDKNWRYTYRVSKRVNIPTSQKYLVGGKAVSQLVLIRDKNNETATVVEANFLNSEERVQQ